MASVVLSSYQSAVYGKIILTSKNWQKKSMQKKTAKSLQVKILLYLCTRFGNRTFLTTEY